MLEKVMKEIDDLPVITDMDDGCLLKYADVEDIIRKHMNDGWIPVEQRLPTKEECDKDNNTFIVQTDSGYRFSCEYDPLANGYDNPLWCCNVPVIAWQPLPEPYRTEKGAKIC